MGRSRQVSKGYNHWLHVSRWHEREEKEFHIGASMSDLAFTMGLQAVQCMIGGSLDEDSVR